MCERRKLLEENIKEVKNHIMISEQSLIKVRCLVCCLLFVCLLFTVTVVVVVYSGRGTCQT